MICWLGVLALFISNAQPLYAQGDPNTQRGVRPFGSYNGGNIDTIDLSNGSLAVDIPLISYPQRGGKLGLGFKLHYRNNGNYYDVSCAPQGSPCGADGLYYFDHGFSIVREGEFAARVNCLPILGDPLNSHQCSAAIEMSDGPVHTLLPTTPNNWLAIDGSGFQANMDMSLYFAPFRSVTDANGVRSTSLSPGAPGTIEDTNGNLITVTSDNYIDTMGRVVPKTYAATTDYTGCTGPLPTASAYVWNFPGLNGGSYPIKFCYGGPVTEISDFYTQQTTLQAHPLQSLVLPDGSAWTFEYTTDTKGDLKQITFPDGGTLSYTWTSPALLKASHSYTFTRGIATRTLNPNNGVTPAATWSYTYGRSVGGPTTTRVKDPDLNETLHSFVPHPQTLRSFYESEAKFFQGPSANGALLKTEQTEYKFSDAAIGTAAPIRKTTIWPNGKQSKIEADHDTAVTFHNIVFKGDGNFNNAYDTTRQGSYGLVLATREYDYGDGAPGPLLKSTTTTHLALINGDYLNNNLLSLPSAVRITDGAGAQQSYTSFGYDGVALVSSGITTQHNPQPSAGAARGNLTSINHWLNGGAVTTANCSSPVNGYVVNRNTYYDTGAVAQSVDACGRTTTFAYSPVFAGAYQTQTTSPIPDPSGSSGSSTPLTTSANYDFSTGLVTSITDANGQTTTYEYNDPFNRLTKVNRSDGGWTSYEYVRSPGNPSGAAYVVARTSLDGARTVDSLQFFDGLGRSSRQFQSESGSRYLVTDTQYDLQGRVWRVSNPYRSAGTGGPINPSGEWTTTQYDALGRVTTVTAPDGASIYTAYNSNQAMVTDQTGKRRSSETDGLGRLVKVTEDPNGLNYDTYYSYDVLGNVRQVTQGSQTRSFVYDSLSRLISATNPESGTITYAYDSNGNLIEKKDARGVRTTVTYDALNRARSKIYTGLTPEGTTAANATFPVFYFYDDYSTLPSGAPTWPGTPSKGRLIGVTYGSGSDGTYYKYDALGGIATNHQRQGTANYATTYTYNLAGAETVESRGNPIRRRNLMTYDEAGRLSVMQTTAYPFLSVSDLVRDVSYTPFGALQSETYGNGLIHSMDYNVRLQPTEIRVGRPDNLESVFRINYIFGTAYNVNGQDPEITLAHNNGNAARIKYFISGALQYSQTFQYDPVNRLRYAVEHKNGVYNDGARAWYQTFDYDRYGNRGINVANTSDNVDAANSALQLADFSAANNRITRAGFAYDAAGNLIAEPGKNYAYDAENRIVTAAVAGGGTSQYVYDGNGRRVKKIVGGVATRFEYGAGGELIAERNDANGALIKEYFYKGGILATSETGTTYEYATADHLGSPRAWTNQDGALVVGGRHDYRPFGEELFAGYGLRATDQGYAANTQADGQRKQFGSKDRDSETGLDYSYARYYSPAQGRFTSVDPEVQQVGAMVNPQNWNGYAYAINNPLTYVDRTGKWPTEIHNLIIQLAFPGLYPHSIESIQTGSHGVDVPNTILESHANEHAMQGLGQTLGDAHKGYQQFIDLNSSRASSEQLEWSKSPWANPDNLCFYSRFGGGSLDYFGRAIHPIMDNTSPAHMPFQLYEGLSLKGNVYIDSMLISAWIGGLWEHSSREASISDAQLNGAISAVREHFKNVYGETLYRQAVPLLFENATFSVVDGKPILNAGNLGTITVHPDGTMQYEGPLFKSDPKRW